MIIFRAGNTKSVMPTKILPKLIGASIAAAFAVAGMYIGESIDQRYMGGLIGCLIGAGVSIWAIKGK